jgi:hypothetical protein
VWVRGFRGRLCSSVNRGAIGQSLFLEWDHFWCLCLIRMNLPIYWYVISSLLTFEE